MHSVDELKPILRREEECRHSSATQQAYAAVEVSGSDSDWLGVTAEMQERVLAEAGVAKERMAAALWLLRSAHDLWPDDDEMQSISCWVRHNRARAGSLASGDRAPDSRLHPLVPNDSSSSSRGSAAVCADASVLSVCAGKPTLLVAGSWS